MLNNYCNAGIAIMQGYVWISVFELTLFEFSVCNVYVAW